MAEFLTMQEAEDKFGKKGRTNAAQNLAWNNRVQSMQDDIDLQEKSGMYVDIITRDNA